MQGFDYAAQWQAYTFAHGMGEPMRAITQRMEGVNSLVRAEWNAHFADGRPATEGAVLDFYATSLTYVYDVLGRAMAAQHEGWPGECARWLLKYDCRDVLDYGCGVSAIGFGLAEEGLRVTLAELPCRHYGFLFWLAQQRMGMSIRHPQDLKEKEQWDAIVCLEVFEHMLRPDEGAREVLKHLRPGGILFASWSFPGKVRGNPLHVESGWTNDSFEALLESEQGMTWLNPGPCWARVLQKPRAAMRAMSTDAAGRGAEWVSAGGAR